MFEPGIQHLLQAGGLEVWAIIAAYLFGFYRWILGVGVIYDDFRIGWKYEGTMKLIPEYLLLISTDKIMDRFSIKPGRRWVI